MSTVLSSSRNNLLEIDWNVLTSRSDYDNDKIKLDFTFEEDLAAQGKYSKLIQHISLILTGKASHPHQQDIIDAFSSYSYNVKWVVQIVVFMIVISSEFTVLEQHNEK